MFDKIGTEFKELEKAFQHTLPFHMPVIMRLDGKAFHTFTRPFKKPFSNIIHNAMVHTAAVLCKEIQNARFAYAQSDEISILIYEQADKSQTWFGNRIQKMVSVASSVASNAFNRQIAREILDRVDGDGFPIAPFKDSLPRNEAVFDARVFSIDPDQVAKYFQWRQEDAVRNSISMLAQAHFSHKKLHKKNRHDMIAMLQSKDIEWKSLENWKKYGSTIVKMWREKEGLSGVKVHRSYWDAKEKSPFFNNCIDFCPTTDGLSDPDFIEKHLEQEKTNV